MAWFEGKKPSKAKKSTKPKPPEYPKVVETFSPYMGNYLSNGTSPNVFNGIVEVEKYRITVEKIEEPVEILQARLQKLWEECDNHHHVGPLRQAAARLGVTLTGDRGAKAPPRSY